MAITYNAPIRVGSLAVGNNVVMAVAADGHAYVYPVPATGVAYPQVTKIVAPTLPSNANAGEGLYTVYLSGTPYELPKDFTINGNTDWVVTATGTS